MKSFLSLFKRRRNKASVNPDTTSPKTIPSPYESVDKKHHFIRPEISFSKYILNSHPELSLPISGGYGFCEEDAIVIDADNVSAGAELENQIIPLRVAAELASRYCPGQPILGTFRISKEIQSLKKGHNGRFFEMLNFTILALSKEDSEYMNNEMAKNNNFRNNPQGKAALVKQMQAKEIAIPSVCWFDTTGFFAKH